MKNCIILITTFLLPYLILGQSYSIPSRNYQTLYFNESDLINSEFGNKEAILYSIQNVKDSLLKVFDFEVSTEMGESDLKVIYEIVNRNALFLSIKFVRTFDNKVLEGFIFKIPSIIESNYDSIIKKSTLYEPHYICLSLITCNLNSNFETRQNSKFPNDLFVSWKGMDSIGVNYQVVFKNLVQNIISFHKENLKYNPIFEESNDTTNKNLKNSKVVLEFIENDNSFLVSVNFFNEESNIFNSEISIFKSYFEQENLFLVNSILNREIKTGLINTYYLN